MNITVCPKCNKLLHINNLQLHGGYYGEPYTAFDSKEARDILKAVRLDFPEELTFAWCNDCSPYSKGEDEAHR